MNVLDGCMWHSKEKVEGRLVRVNYYISELFGDPSESPDVWTSPLAILVASGDSTPFKHPAVRMVLELKWKHFGLPIFLLIEGCFTVVLALFMATHVGTNEEDAACTQDKVNKLILTTTGSLILLLWQLSVVATQIWRRKTVLVGVKGYQVLLPRYLSHFWPWVRLLAGILVFALMFVEECGLGTLAGAVGDSGSQGTRRLQPAELSGKTVLRSLAALLLWVQVTQATVVSTRMAAFTYIIGIMVDDLTNTFVMIGILLLGFASALSIIHDAPFSTLQDSILVLTQELLGMSTPSYDETSWLSMLLILVFIIAVVVGFLNILVAQLTITYKGLTKDKEGFALKHRAQVCLDIEDLLPVAWRTKIFRELGFDRELPFGKDDVGPPGGIQVVEPDTCDRYEPDRIMRFTGASTATDPWAVVDEPSD
ncbi:hypothetical protein T484DRAFT_1889118 [Baffinella frigidus]|nr:hypothetical protein T484DRAFT_1889118 [Cryptophyta sp. CCMP2293]